MLKTILSTVIFIVSSSSLVYAAVDNPANGNTSFDFFKILFSLVFVLFLIYFLFWLLKKNNKITGSRIYNHLGGLSLGQNKSVQIIEIGKKIYVLGVGEEVNLLEVVQNDEEKAAIKDSSTNYSSNTAGVNNFIKEKLTQLLSGRKQNNNSLFAQELAEKIAQMKDKRAQSVNSLLYDDERTEKSEQHEED